MRKYSFGKKSFKRFLAKIAATSKSVKALKESVYSYTFDWNNKDDFIDSEAYDALERIGEEFFDLVGAIKGLSDKVPEYLLKNRWYTEDDREHLRELWKSEIKDQVEADVFNLGMVYDSLMDITMINVPEEKQQEVKRFYSGLKRSTTAAMRKYEQAKANLEDPEDWVKSFSVIVENTDKALTFLTNFFELIEMPNDWPYTWPAYRKRQKSYEEAERFMAQVFKLVEAQDLDSLKEQDKQFMSLSEEVREGLLDWYILKTICDRYESKI